MVTTIQIDYNNLSVAKKTKTELVRIEISNHPDFPGGVKWIIEIPRALYDIITA